MRTLKTVHHKILTPIRKFINDSRATGILLIVCTIVSIALSNFAFSSTAYVSFWHQHFSETLSSLNLPNSPLHIINDVCMSFFFLLVGLEIKRELLVGELKSVRKSVLPVLAALGGMIVPAIIFTIFNGNTPFHHGWGIPMATDIAFSLGVLSLLGNRVPVQLKIFLTALAIIDDLGAIVTIALFYSAQLNWIYLLFAVLALGLILLLNKLKVQRIIYYIIPGAILWYCVFNSGIDASIAGVLFALCMPIDKISKIEQLLFYPVNFAIMPLFALANTAIILPSAMGSALTSTISFGIMLGLILGKPIGIFLFSFIASKIGIASMPSRTNYRELFGVSMLGGIGFTMSIFTASLAFNFEGLQIISKVAIIAGSLISAVAGYMFLRRVYGKKKTSIYLLNTADDLTEQDRAMEILAPRIVNQAIG
ncbi:Na+/H+ antiporter NhaA [Arachidicoccus soli]|uniref:Na(+)/H(+) antiporter NhaA n=1 Tax=Arachidicoccus soli TaxID=2341117 RepID=A0A386HMA1_9BACT|nr:Na+/H+ antiporter NhaA [Arachidicoccus soli]AYD46660.1 Na+/H+ antiporter NhaA [Arachidicoccus soli]